MSGGVPLKDVVVGTVKGNRLFWDQVIVLQVSCLRPRVLSPKLQISSRSKVLLRTERSHVQRSARSPLPFMKLQIQQSLTFFHLAVIINPHVCFFANNFVVFVPKQN